MPRLAEHSFQQICEADTLELMRARGLDPRQNGKTATVHCPFHGQGRERTPSLHVWPDGGWHCFSCRTGGRGGVDFIWKHDQLPSWTDAAEVAAGLLGLTLEYDGREASAGPSHADLRAALAAAAVHYSAQLLCAPEALAYAERRGLGADLRQRWLIGYACADRVRDCGAPEDHLVLAGVLKRRDDGSTYDPLHARLVIPLHDPAGRVVGFTGRALADSGPKYVNTSDTPLFAKGRLLWGLHRARELLRRLPGPVYLLEGQLKAMAALEAGIPAVAPGGTAFTPDQAGLVIGLSRHVCLAFDRNSAGVKATADAAVLLRQHEAIVEVAALVLPPGSPAGASDPDDLMAADLPIAYTTQSLASWALEHLPTQPAGSPAWAAEVTGPVIELLSSHPNDAVRECELKEIVELTGLSARALRRRSSSPLSPIRPISPIRSLLPPASASPAPTERSPMTPGRLLCALALQAPLNGAEPNSWVVLLPWVDLHPDLVRTLLLVGRLRSCAAYRRVSLAAVLDSGEFGADAAGQSLADLVGHLRAWLTAPLPENPDGELWGELCRQLVDSEHLRRIKGGIL